MPSHGTLIGDYVRFYIEMWEANPNSESETVALLVSVFMDVQKPKADKAVYAELENKEEVEKVINDN